MQYVLQAFQTVLQPYNIIVIILATGSGLLMGMLPGLSATMAIALLTGLTYNFPTQSALIALIGVYVGAISGGCQSAILINIPGTPASAATALDGHPIAKRGEGGLGIFLATTASMFGTLISVIFVLSFTPVLTKFALKFASWEFFMIAIFGILICGQLTSNGNALKGWISGILGLIVSMVGLDVVDTFPRFSYGNVNLMGGIQLIPVMIGLFGFPEIVKAFKRGDNSDAAPMSSFNMKKGWSLVKNHWWPMVRSGIIGVCVGIIPGVGEDVGGWLSYWTSKNTSKDPESFGKGNELGVISAETGNNSCIGGAIIPVLSLAVPGSAPAAVLLAAFYMHGYRPGPLLMSETPDFIYRVGIYLALAAIVMWALAILSLDKRILMPIIYVLCVIGSYLINYNLFDVKVMFVFGLVGIALSNFEFPASPFLLGVILGSMADQNLRRGLRISKGSLGPMLQRPICVVFLIVNILMILSQTGLFKNLMQKLKSSKKTEE